MPKPTSELPGSAFSFYAPSLTRAQSYIASSSFQRSSASSRLWNESTRVAPDDEIRTSSKPRSVRRTVNVVGEASGFSQIIAISVLHSGTQQDACYFCASKSLRSRTVYIAARTESAHSPTEIAINNHWEAYPTSRRSTAPSRVTYVLCRRAFAFRPFSRVHDASQICAPFPPVFKGDVG